MKILSIFLLSVMLSQLSIAKYSSVAKIVDVYAYGADNAVIKLSIDVPDTGCSRLNFMVIPEYSTTNSGMYAAILSASVTQQDIQIGYTPGNCSDLWGTNSLNIIYSLLLKST